MHHAITAITDELKRLKAAGVKTVSVSDDSIARLRATQSRRQSSQAAPTKPVKSAVERSETPERASREVAPSAPKATIQDAGIPKDAVASKGRSLPALPAPIAFTLPDGEKSARMAALRERVLGDAVCRANVRPGKQIVVGVGSLDAKIMFVGEAPGAEEEDCGEPFVGPAGKLLTKMIGAMGLSREDVYIGNIMNWRPQLEANASGVQYGNRPPTPEEMAYCLPYLRAQIDVVNPAFLVALGTTAAQGLLGAGAFKALAEVRGRWTEFAGRPLMVTYHPSYILRNQSNRSKRMIWEDLLKVMERAALPITDKQRAYFLEK